MLGRALVLLAMIVAFYSALAAVGSQRRRAGEWVVVRPELLDSARRALVAAAVSLAGASAALWYALFTRDFSLSYVALHTSRATQPWYTFAALWAGMDGSMLLWCLVLAVYAAAFAGRRRPMAEPFVPWAVPVLGGTLGFFCAMTAGPVSPFRGVDLLPADGRGLNPLLQSPAMVIHPPLLYAGLVGLAVPFAVAVAALVTGRTGADWVRVVRRWTLVPWLALGAGLVLGGAWAYTELGWGGYWGWDPVENAALMPWLAATAFLHSAVVQERRGMLKVWNIFLVTAAADLAVFGTFLTRSGLLSSVHTFTESPLGRWFFIFLGLQTLVGLSLLAWRLPLLRSDNALDGALSKESGFLVNNLLFVGAAIAVLWGTVLPLITEAMNGRRLAVGPPFFNRVISPLGALLLLMAAIGPVLSWRRGSLDALARRLAGPAASATVVAAASLAVSRRPAFSGLLWLAALVASVSVREISAAARARGSLWSVLARNPRRYGGYLVHLGIAVMVVGFAGSLFRSQADVTASPGERFTFAGYTIRYRALERSRALDKDVRLAVLDVFVGSHPPRRVATLRPQQNLHLNFDQPQSEIAIRTTPASDLYVILTGSREGSDVAAFRLYHNPLVFWVWTGAAVSVAGGLVAALARPRRRRRETIHQLREVAPVSTP